MGAELDPREEGLDVVEEIAIVLSWIPAVPPNLRYYTFGAELCQAPNLRHVFIFCFLFFFHLTVDSHPIPTQLVESFLSYISLLYARTRKLDTGMKRNLRGCLPG